MLLSPASHEVRHPRTERLQTDFAVVGGGLSGVCAAICAARAGLQVVLVQDRPVLGGNASSEVRLWTLGATAHMSAPNRWAREGGVVDEILVENQWRNPEGNAVIFDTVLLDFVVREPNITLLLNTAVFEVQKSGPDEIQSVSAWCSQNSTRYEIEAPLWCDASGDGIVAFGAGAAFRIGAESRDEFGEGFAPTQEYGELLGHSIYFYSKDAGTPVEYTAPSYALTVEEVETQIPRYRSFNTKNDGCRLWWIEYGGRLDTIHATEQIKWELWRVAFGAWNYLKNSGKFADAANLTLEWVGHVPGKRESRRFEGDYLLRQQDVIEGRHFEDAVAFGGWALDLHPADGVYSDKPGCTHWRMRGIYPIPYRTLYSRNISNLFLGGRIMSVTHAAYGSTRVMATLAHCAQAIGHAAALCHKHQIGPREVGERIEELQLELNRNGQHIPRVPLCDPQDLARVAQIEASSEFELSRLEAGEWALEIGKGRGQMLPLSAGTLPRVTLRADVEAETNVELQIRVSQTAHFYDFNEIVARRVVTLEKGDDQPLVFDFDLEMPDARYVLFAVVPTGDAVESVKVRLSETRLSGVLSLRFAYHQDPRGGDGRGQSNVSSDAEDIGVESFDVWLPNRRPAGQNLALEIEPPLRAWNTSNLVNGWARPTNATNIYLASETDPNPRVTFRWNEPKRIARLELGFDTDFDHPMETVLMGHPERAIPFCVKSYRIRVGETVVFDKSDNHQTRNTVRLETPLETDELTLELLESWGEVPKGLFEVRVYKE